MSEASFIMYLIETKRPPERIFKPMQLAFARKRDAIDRAAELREKFAHIGRQYRVTPYWEKRPW